jgi:hypothetical protein
MTSMRLQVLAYFTVGLFDPSFGGCGAGGGSPPDPRPLPPASERTCFEDVECPLDECRIARCLGNRCVPTDAVPDIDGDGVMAAPCGDDCDDGNATVAAGVAEQCDRIDNDCDGAVDEGAPFSVQTLLRPAFGAAFDAVPWGEDALLIGDLRSGSRELAWQITGEPFAPRVSDLLLPLLVVEELSAVAGADGTVLLAHREPRGPILYRTVERAADGSAIGLAGSAVLFGSDSRSLRAWRVVPFEDSFATWLGLGESLEGVGEDRVLPRIGADAVSLGPRPGESLSTFATDGARFARLDPTTRDVVFFEPSGVEAARFDIGANVEAEDVLVSGDGVVYARSGAGFGEIVAVSAGAGVTRTYAEAPEHFLFAGDFLLAASRTPSSEWSLRVLDRETEELRAEVPLAASDPLRLRAATYRSGVVVVQSAEPARIVVLAECAPP